MIEVTLVYPDMLNLLNLIHSSKNEDISQLFWEKPLLIFSSHCSCCCLCTALALMSRLNVVFVLFCFLSYVIFFIPLCRRFKSEEWRTILRHLMKEKQKAYQCPNVSKFSTLNSAEFVSAVCKIDLDECFIDHQYYLS